jgi:exopolysaccharide biosynthesis polyprenyl glycosylphosphotransferase
LNRLFPGALFIFTDYLAAFLAYAIFFSIRQKILGEPASTIHTKQILAALSVALFWILVYWMWGLYHGVERRSRFKEVLNLAGVSFVGTVIIFFILLLDDVGVKSYTQYYKTAASLLFIHFCLSSIFRISLLTWVKIRIAKGLISFRTLIIGCGEKANQLIKELERSHSYLGLKIVGYLKVNSEESILPEGIKNYGHLSEMEEILESSNPEDVIIALDGKDHHFLEGIINRLDNFSVNTAITPDLYEILIGSVRVQHIFGAPLIEVRKRLVPIWVMVVKRTFDVFASILVMILGLPLFIAFSMITLFSSKGPVFFLQERIGYKGRPFNIIKFRSMIVDAEKEGPALSSQNDGRVTKWGRFMRRSRIDEMPQFINVFRGEMSIVGPRPERKFFIDQIVERAPYYRHLQKIKPGITSLGQVKLGYAENLDQMVERLKYDVLYLENISIGLDLRILFFTIFIILQGRGK